MVFFVNASKRMAFENYIHYLNNLNTIIHLVKLLMHSSHSMPFMVLSF